jgi:oxalate decarboxylase/phosphoglucose isomerase-like protein (cupin superfamily)
MLMTELTLVRHQDAEIVMEGGECVRLFANTGKIMFSVATLPAGQRGALDPGHGGAHEVAYLVKGNVVFEFPNRKDSKKWLELHAGDAVIIPEGEAHSVINIGAEAAEISWSLAPDLGRPWLTK